PRDARVGSKESCRRRSDPEFLVRFDRKRAWLPGTPARLRDPEVGAEPRAQIQEDRTQASLCGETRGDRRALVHDQEVTGAQEPRQVLEAGVVVPVGPGDEETDVVAGAAANLRGFVGEDAFGSLEHELSTSHVATSHTAACA